MKSLDKHHVMVHDRPVCCGHTNVGEGWRRKICETNGKGPPQQPQSTPTSFQQKSNKYLKINNHHRQKRKKVSQQIIIIIINIIFFVSVLISSLLKRFNVFCMQDYFVSKKYQCFLIEYTNRFHYLNIKLCFSFSY